LCNHSRTSQHFMEPEISSPCSPLVPVLSHINPIHTIPSYLSKIHFNIVPPTTSWSSKWSLSFWLPTSILYAFLCRHPQLGTTWSVSSPGRVMSSGAIVTGNGKIHRITVVLDSFPSSCVLRNRNTTFRNCFCPHLMGRVQKPSNSACYTPSSEPFKIY
jgi:hypothetical protein